MRGEVSMRGVSGYRKCELNKWSRDDSVQVIEVKGNYEVLVDKWYYDKNCLFDWKIRSGYAYRIDERGIVILMARDVLRANDSEYLVDHIDGNTLHNCESNLRLCTHAENSYNTKKTIKVTTSEFKGVCKCGGVWVASIKKSGKTINLGRHKKELDAALAYDTAAVYLFGEFARINFPQHKDKLLIECLSG